LEDIEYLKIIAHKAVAQYPIKCIDLKVCFSIKRRWKGVK
jgi:hypothetical protein